MKYNKSRQSPLLAMGNDYAVPFTTVPWFWPLAASIELGQEGMHFFQSNMRFMHEVEHINMPSAPQWATPHCVVLELDTLTYATLAPSSATPTVSRYSSTHLMPAIAPSFQTTPLGRAW